MKTGSIKLNASLYNLLQKDDVRVFIDTCSMMRNNFDYFLEALVPVLGVNHKKLIIPNSCLKEIEKHKRNPRMQKKANSAFETLKIINQFIDIRGNENDGKFADNVFLCIFTQFRLKYNLILITEDKKLKSDVLNLNKSKSVLGKRVYVFNIKEALSLNKQDTNHSSFSKDTIVLTSIPNTPISLSSLPQQGDYVFTKQGRKIQLVEDFKAGGEGTVYKIDIDDNIVAKIYHKGKLTERKKAKLSTLISKNIIVAGVCLPTELVYNAQGEVIGYLMSLVKGRTLDGTIFKGEKGFTRFFPTWTRDDLLDLCLTIVSTIQELHEKGIILGDINGSNILIESPTKVNFVDTDSFQVDGFPCPVGKEDFTAPEIQGKEYDSFLRTEGNESFAMATLLFKILMYGQKPYAKLDCEDIMQNIKEGDFSYPYKQNSNNKIPNGNWCYFWSHLHPKVKETFFLTFKKGERLYDEVKRPTTRYWLKLLKLYKKNLHDGYLSKVDEESLKLFPKTYKKVPGHTYAMCSLCGREIDTEYMHEGWYCNECIKGMSESICKSCGEKFKYSNYKEYILHERVSDLCPNCLKKKVKQIKKEEEKRQRQAYCNKVYMMRECSVCGKIFTITNRERDYFVSKGLDMPKRCKDCRDNNRHKTYESNNKWDNSNKRRGFCFITTAVCDYYGKPDDCVELTKLRFFRDNWLMRQKNGPLDVSVYYDCAPDLVEKMIKSSDYGETCKTIMKEYIQPCIRLIDAGRNSECRKKYFDLVKFMMDKYN